ncbi:MAG: TrkA family potassium uptake protein [Halarsenatibacteraceae bacterium]
MKVIIVGGGKIGRYLTNELKDKYEIVLIEQDRNKCDRIKEKYGIRIVCGDGSKPEILEEAGIENADVVLPVTEDDQDNLVICQLAERQYDVKRTFTRVNTPGNERLFDWLGVNVAISSSSILTGLVNQEVAMQDLKGILTKNHDNLEMLRVTVKDGAKAVNKKLKNLDLPIEVVLVSILRGDKPIVPRGNTTVCSGDMIVVLAREDFKDDIYEIFT